MTNALDGGVWPVVIVGGGPAASAMAIGLTRRGCDVLIIDKSDGTGDKIGETLPPDARPVLAELGVDLAQLSADHRPSWGTRSAWSQAAPDEHNFFDSPYGHGWHLDRVRFESMLAGQAVDGGASRIAGAAVTDVARSADGWRLRLNTGAAVSTSFVVDASGRPAWLGRRMGARRRYDDRLQAVVAFLRPSPISSIDVTGYGTLVEAAETGWWYSADLPDGRLATAYMCDASTVDRETRTPQRWRELLSDCQLTLDRAEAAGAHLDGPIRIANAESSLLDPLLGPGWLAIGDAAVAYDPISSYGITAAMRGGLEAADAVLAGPDALVDYAMRIERGWTVYRVMRQALYQQEQRWADAPFWAVRSGALVTPSSGLTKL